MVTGSTNTTIKLPLSGPYLSIAQNLLSTNNNIYSDYRFAVAGEGSSIITEEVCSRRLYHHAGPWWTLCIYTSRRTIRSCDYRNKNVILHLVLPHPHQGHDQLCAVPFIAITKTRPQVSKGIIPELAWDYWATTVTVWPRISITIYNKSLKLQCSFCFLQWL